MGTFSIPIEIGAERGGPIVALEALVDTGAVFSLIPARILEELGVERLSHHEGLIIANGQTIEADVGDALIGIGGVFWSSPVMFADEPNQPALLGAIALEAHLLAVDPVARRLVPRAAFMY